MIQYRINGGYPLQGAVDISGMKNAALPILYGCILVDDDVIIENVPQINDVEVTLSILREMGCEVEILSRDTVRINAAKVVGGSAPAELVRKMRASYYLLGAEIGRFGRSHVCYPGGCDFGVRPIDQHIKGFEALGVEINVDQGDITAAAPGGLIGDNIFFDLVSVGATMNVMLAAVRAEGVTIIENAAREPHIVDLANFLNTCGAKITGAGTDAIKIKGVPSLHGCTYTIIPDMIEAGTYMIAAAATRGNLRIRNVIPRHLESITAKLQEIGVTVIEGDDSVLVSHEGPFNRANVKTLPYPGFPTDMQPQMAVLFCLANGISRMNESVFDNRFRYTEQLIKMGAKIDVKGKIAIFEGISELHPAEVTSTDLRAGAAMVIAALATNGETTVSNAQLIERGYDDIVGKLKAVGAKIERYEVDDTVVEKADYE